MNIQNNTCPGCKLFEPSQYLRKFTPDEVLELGGLERPATSWWELTPQMQSLMHIAHWFENREHLFPVIQKEGICLSKKKWVRHSSNLNACERDLVNFAKEHLFYADMEHMNEHSRMSIEWFFSDVSRKLSQTNPLSRWVTINYHSCIPFDVATTFGEVAYLKDHKSCKIVDLKSKHTLYKPKFSLYSKEFDHLNFAPLHLVLESDSDIASLKDFMKLPFSPRLSQLRLDSSDEYSSSTSPRSPGSGRRRPALTPRSLDIANLLLESSRSE